MQNNISKPIKIFVFIVRFIVHIHSYNDSITKTDMKGSGVVKVNLSESGYLSLKEFFETHIPEVKIHSVIKDEALYNLGVVNYVPCIVEFKITREQIERINDILWEYDIAAIYSREDADRKNKRDIEYDLFETHPEERKTKEEEIYEKYMWIEGMFDNWKEEDEE